ncbi:MAG: dicarboxylate/amino acid:cation symporter, partial [Candidatus Acidiferrales bacterium]
MTNRLLMAFLAICAIVAALELISHAGVLYIAPVALLTLRWLAVAMLAVYATARRSLTLWILVGLLAGAEFG